MKHRLIKRITVAALALCLCLSLAPGAWAQEESGDDGEFQEIFAELCRQYEAEPGNVFAGYMDLVTGEEHYHQGDEYVIAGSMYKVPLCMIFAQRIASGELGWDEHYPYRGFQDVLDAAIVNSDNETAGFLWGQLGSFVEFRRICAPYMGEDPDTVDDEYYLNNLFTSRQMIACLQTLYDGQEDFPGIIEAMSLADKERFFSAGEERFDVAQKYGFCHDDADVSAYLNCCGIVYTDDPIAIVMFTKDVYHSEELLGAYCAAMCDYAQQSRAARLELEAGTAEALTSELLPPPVTAMSAAAAGTASVLESSRAADSGGGGSSVLAAILVLLLAAAALTLLALRRKKYGIKSFWFVVTVILAVTAMLLGVVGMSQGTVYARPDGDPQAVAAEFFDALKAADYDHAYGLLRGRSDLGLEDRPQSEAGQIVFDALRQSYDYELLGSCAVDKLQGVQRVKLRYLDLTAIQDSVREETIDELEKIVQSRSHSQVYDKNEQYLPEVANEAYLKAVETVMGEAEKYYAEAEFDLSLSYADGRWQIVEAPAMLKALNGNAGY